MNKIVSSQNLLKSIGMSPRQTAELPAITLLALAGLKEQDKWNQAQNNWLRIHDIIAFVNQKYGYSYAENSRETFRKQAIQHFRIAGIIEDNGKSTNSPNYRYRLTPEFLELVIHYGSDEWNLRIGEFCDNHESLISLYESKRNFKMVPVIINGENYAFSTGNHNLLQKAIIEEFAPRFAPGAEVLYVGDTINKGLVLNIERFEQLGFNIIVHDKMPDVVLYNESNNWLYFIEAVTSVGEINPKRIIEIEKMTKNCYAGNVYITAFLDFNTYKKFSNRLAWDTEVWLAEQPDHMIHLNGDRFLGPR